MIRPASRLMILVGVLSARDPTTPMPTQPAIRDLARADRQTDAPVPVDTAGRGELSTLLDVVSGGLASAHATTRCAT